MRAALVLPTLALLAAGPLAGQDLTRPDGWMTRFDRPGPPDSAVYLVTMPPGWHIRTGPGGIHYSPDSTASGTYRIESTMFLFPATRPHEGYGIFFGGQDLTGGEQTYGYFLIRGEGSFIVKRRDGSGTSTLVPWTRHEAIARHDPDGQARNEFAIVVGAETVEFHVNGTRLTSVPRADIPTDGIVGLRVSHASELHVTGLVIK